MKEKTVNIAKWICFILIICCFIDISIHIIKSDEFNGVVLKKGLTIKNLNNISYDNENVYAELETYNLIIKKDLWCIATEGEIPPDFNDVDWQQIVNNKCKIKISNDDKYVYIRDKKM